MKKKFSQHLDPFLDIFWNQLGSIWGRFWRPNWSHVGTKCHQNQTPKPIKKNECFWEGFQIDFQWMLAPTLVPSWDQVGSKLAQKWMPKEEQKKCPTRGPRELRRHARAGSCRPSKENRTLFSRDQYDIGTLHFVLQGHGGRHDCYNNHNNYYSNSHYCNSSGGGASFFNYPVFGLKVLAGLLMFFRITNAWPEIPTTNDFFKYHFFTNNVLAVF